MLSRHEAHGKPSGSDQYFSENKMQLLDTDNKDAYFDRMNTFWRDKVNESP